MWEKIISQSCPLPSTFPPKHLHQPPDRAEPLILLFSMEPRGENGPMISWGRAAFWQDKHQCINCCCRKHKAFLRVMGGCVWDREGTPESPHSAAGNRASDQRVSSGSAQLCGVIDSWHSSVRTTAKPHTSESPGTFTVALGAPLSQDILHKEPQLVLLITVSGYGRLVQNLLPWHSRLSLSYKDWSKLHRWSMLRHSAVSSRSFSLHYAWNYYQEGDSYLFKCSWGHLFNH